MCNLKLKGSGRKLFSNPFGKFYKNAIVLVSIVGLANLGIISSSTKAETVFLKGTAYQSGIARKDIKVGTSEVVVANKPIKRVAVTDPSVAGVKVLSDTTALVMGRKVGRTSLLIWEGKEADVRPSRFDITVKRDIGDLIASLKLIDPNIEIDYIIVPSTRLEPINQAPNSNGAYTTSYNVDPQIVGDPAPSVVVSNQASSQPIPAAAASNDPNAAGGVVERIILTGRVKSADVIAKAMTITATYMGQDSNIRIVTRNGGMIVDQLNQLLSEADASGGASLGGSQTLTRPLSFTSNLRGNLGNGSIVSNNSGTIMSFLEVAERPQISVLIRFYEVSRSIGKEFSTRFAWQPGGTGKGGYHAFGAGGNLPSVTGTQTNSSTFGTSLVGGATAGAALGTADSGSLTFSASAGASPGTFFSLFPKQQLAFAIQALENRGEVKVLAEPNLVVASGEPGQFLAGGEIPIQQSLATLGAVGQQVTFETFGISLNVLPTITDDDTVIMNVGAQTRDLDTTNPFAAAGLPAFRTRKADTQVEMDPSQVLVIGGLINANSINNLSKVPFLGDIPVLGALARSKEFSRSDSELIIVLAPEIVRGANSSQVMKPLALDANPDPGQFNYIPTQFPTFERTSIPVAAPQGMTHKDPVDLGRPATVNDLDHIYK